MNHQKETLFFAVLTLLVQSAPAAEAATVPQWSVHEITLEAERTFENPKVQVKKRRQIKTRNIPQCTGRSSS